MDENWRRERRRTSVRLILNTYIYSSKIYFTQKNKNKKQGWWKLLSSSSVFQLGWPAGIEHERNLQDIFDLTRVASQTKHHKWGRGEGRKEGTGEGKKWGRRERVKGRSGEVGKGEGRKWGSEEVGKWVSGVGNGGRGQGAKSKRGKGEREEVGKWGSGEVGKWRSGEGGRGKGKGERGRDRQTYRQTDRRTDGWTDGRTDREYGCCVTCFPSAF